MNKKLELLILLNCILIEDNIRECFLHWCKKTHNMIKYITNRFPNLKLNEHLGKHIYSQFETCDVVLVSKRKVELEECNTNDKLGKLLGYKSAENFDKLNRDLITYNYTFKVLIEGEIISLYNEMSQNKLYLNDTLEKIKESLYNNKYYLEIEDIYLEERIIIPVKYLIDKLKEGDNLTSDELFELQNCLWNEGLDNIYNKNLLKNNEYRKLMIEFLERFRNDGNTFACFSDKEIKDVRDKYMKIVL